MVKNILKWFVSFDRYVYLQLKARNIKSVNLYGSGYLGVEVFLYLQSKGIEIEDWYDIKANKEAFSVLGHEIQATTSMQNAGKEKFTVICSKEFEQVMLQECLTQSLVENQVISWSK